MVGTITPPSDAPHRRLPTPMQAISAGLTRVGIKLAARNPAIKRVASPRALRANRAVYSRTMATSIAPMNAVATDGAAGATKTADTPRWALETHFGYDSVYSGSIDAEIDAIEAKCKTLKANFEGKMGESLLDAIKAYEEVDIALTKALSYVSLSCDTKLDDDKAQKRKASLFQRYSTISGNELTFFSLELADMSQDLLEAQMEKSPELAKYAAYIDDVRRSQPYNLSKEVERALTVRAPFAGKGKVVEFYGNELSRLRFKDGDEEVSLF